MLVRIWIRALLNGFLLLATVTSCRSLNAQRFILTWSDEFNGPAGSFPSTRDWNFETGWGPKDNHEIQWYCEPKSNIGPCEPKAPNVFEDGRGNLVIRAIHAGQRWSSARLNTSHKHQVKYGRIEARIRIEPEAGFWPAFWLLGSCSPTIHWPDCGELDIMEWVEKYDAQVTSSAAHGPGYSGAHGISRRTATPGGGRLDDGQFHTYGMTWSPNRVEFYRDDPESPFFVLTPADLPRGAKWVYDHPFHIVLNQAVSETGFGGAVTISTPRVGNMWVDYVRVYCQTRRQGRTC